MTAPLNVFDHSPRGSSAFLELKDVLRALPARAEATEWEVGPVILPTGESYLDSAALDRDILEEIADSGRRVPNSELRALAETLPQVIWASFRGHEGDTAPWIVLSAIDSHFWKIVTEDSATRQSIGAAFSDVREGDT